MWPYAELLMTSSLPSPKLDAKSRQSNKSGKHDMSITLYELAGADENHRFSPFCWRVRMALAHKGLDFTTVPWRFLEKDKIAHSGQGAVPVLEIDGTVRSDSWTIAEYLESAYPEAPALFTSKTHGEALFIKFWSEQSLAPAIMRLVMKTLIPCLHPDDQDYWRTTRTQRMAGALGVEADVDQIILPPDIALKTIAKTLNPIRTMTQSQDFIGGETPLFSDYIVFGALQWGQLTTPHTIIDDADPLRPWFERMLDLYGGMGRSMSYPA